MKEEEDDFEEIRKLYGNSQRDIKLIVDNFKESEFTSDENNLLGGKGNNYFGRHRDNEYDNNYTGFFNSKYNNQNDINENYPKHIWSYIKKTMPLIVKILKKDPLDQLEEPEITSILICRDYISTIPSALELFLRAIDWLNPLQVSIAHEYIKKWAKLQVEDAISLLDARFPDTETREFAVRMLRDLPDELINMYMLQLCQCLLYETFLVNPLSDFLIERSLINPKLIGNAFFWNSRVSMKNPLFSDRLTIYLLTILMYSGENFLNDCFNGLYLNDYFEFMTYYVKLKKPEGGEPTEHAKVFLDFFTNQLKMTDFTFPIDPTYFGASFGTNWQVFNSKMLPTKIVFRAREKDDTMPVIFKIGDDLRQDVLTLQIFNIMDKLWLENNLDLKLLPYKVCPTELKAGFIECLVGIELDKLQAQDGVAGVLDRELIVKYLRKTGKQSSPLETKFDNFIKSLAGYCVATCVIGIGDRHPGNIMIKENGIFFHIDFGHILGNFKSKFFIKRERTPFLLTPMMANVYSTEGKEEFFKNACVKAYNILRHNAQRLINMFIIMSTAGMPELCSMNDVKYAKKMLKLDMPNDEDAGNYFVGLIKQSKNDRFRLIDNIFHYYKHRKPKKKKGKDKKEEKKEDKEKDKEKEKNPENVNDKDKKKNIINN
jgi:phosphatidylinositol-4,5-bisphosphate 3-kinase